MYCKDPLWLVPMGIEESQDKAQQQKLLVVIIVFSHRGKLLVKLSYIGYFRWNYEPAVLLYYNWYCMFAGKFVNASGRAHGGNVEPRLKGLLPLIVILIWIKDPNRVNPKP